MTNNRVTAARKGDKIPIHADIEAFGLHFSAKPIIIARVGPFQENEPLLSLNREEAWTLLESLMETLAPYKGEDKADFFAKIDKLKQNTQGYNRPLKTG